MTTQHATRPHITEHFLENSPEEMAAWILWCIKKGHCNLRHGPNFWNQLTCAQVNYCSARLLIKNLPDGTRPMGKHDFEPGTSRCLRCGIHRDELSAYRAPDEYARKPICTPKDGSQHHAHQFGPLGLCLRCGSPRKTRVRSEKVWTGKYTSTTRINPETP